MKHFDLAVIGSGSGNTILDHRFDDLDVAVLERGIFGGTCLNVGCIPTKMYVYAADVARTVQHAERYGIDAHVDQVRWPDIVDRVFGRVDPISAGGRRYRSEGTPRTTVYTGEARFTGPHTIDTGTGETITADRIVIAAGSRAIVPDEVLDSGVTFHTNDDVMRLPRLPERLVIVGAGYIATEFAHVFSAFGSAVSLIGRSDVLLRQLDRGIAERFTALAQEKWDVHLGHGLAKVRQGSDVDGHPDIEVELTNGDVVSGDALLVAAGRRPNSDLLDLGAAGVGTHPDGRIMVDEQQRVLSTNGEVVPGVWALGDVSSPYQLKHVANHEARVVQHNLLHPESPRTTSHAHVPAAVFTDPQIATVGLTEEQAREHGLDVTVKVQAYGDVAYGWAMEDVEGVCKVIAERGTGRLLGAHVMGAQASTVIQPLIQAMSFGLSATEMATGQYWIHPALAEVVENALLGLEV
ncbi:mycothione reductase [Rhodococcus sp. X156]|uniref:mycothione reductase n=1 Tax=Rhodococcus sp. X156 TaxID=2499145 RepID=UPI000FD8904E|nr:mycothione reductase [Rhodococcus sp. X156]